MQVSGYFGICPARHYKMNVMAASRVFHMHCTHSDPRAACRPQPHLPQVLVGGSLTGTRHHVARCEAIAVDNGGLLMFIFPTRACVVVASMWFVLTMALYYGGWNIILAHKTTTPQQSLAHPTIIPSFTPRSTLSSAGPTAGDSPLLSSPPSCDTFPYDYCK